MDRNEAVLRELNLYPQWVLRGQHAPVEAGQPAPVATQRAEQHEAANTKQIEKRELAAVVAQEVHTTFSGEAHSAVEARRSAVEARRAVRVPEQKFLVPLQWTELKQRVRDCTACKLRAGCAQTVFGAGDESADWLFVGEGSGAEEDAQGEPFVGEAGRLLDNMLLAIKLKRGENVYIANVVKCRPPGNRNPDAGEIAQCLPYLQRQIELIEPKLIVALGKTASNALLGNDVPLGSLRGTLHDYHGIPLVVTFHPAYLLRSPSEKAKAWQDLCLATEAMQKLL